MSFQDKQCFKFLLIQVNIQQQNIIQWLQYFQYFSHFHSQFLLSSCLKLLKLINNLLHLMFSLADEIEKFQKTILNMPDNVMTIDERFLGGGIKMQDLIQENSFIINQMRKFKGVFLNYCQLNDKIYKKTIQHEVNANEHLNKMVALSSSIDRKIQLSDQQIKKMKEDVFMQISKLRDFTQTNANSIREGWNKKIDQSTFGQKVKQIIDQYDHSDASVQPNANDSESITQQVTIGGKKRRGLTLQDIEAFKSQITPLIDEVNQRVNKQELKISDCVNELEMKKKMMKKIDCQTKWNSEDIVSIKKQMEDMKSYISSQDQKTIQMIRQAINENIWSKKFQMFNNSVVIPSMQKMSNRIDSRIQTLKKDFDQQIKPKLKQINEQMLKIKQKEKVIQSKISKSQQKMSEIAQRVLQIKQQLKVDLQHLDKTFQHSLNDQAEDQKKQFVKLEKQVTLLKKQLDGIVGIIQDAVLKKIEQKLGKQMKEIKGDINILNLKLTETNNNVKFNKEQVNYVKDVVATKANYTDLIRHFDKKADKEEFKQFQQLFTESPKQSRRVMNESLNQRKLSQDQRKRKSSLSKRNTAPLFTRPEEDVGKYLLIGWQSPEKSKQILKSALMQGSKNRSIRPSTANTMFKI